MQTIHIIILSLLLLAVGYTIIRAIKTTKALSMYNFFVDNTAGCCESLGFTGCSVICYAVNDIEQIENLLHTEYDRYEILAVIDSRLYPDIFYSIVKQYGLIRVNTIVSDELSNTHIRALYRSRQRRFRRLVLLDEAYTSPYNSLDCATLVASYEYIIPLNASMRLREHAIEYASILISENRERALVAIHSSADDECYIIKREYIISHDGFSATLFHDVPSTQILSTPTPLIYTINNEELRRRFRNNMCAVTFLILLFEMIWADGLTAVATLLSALLIYLIVKYYNVVANDRFCPEWAMLCYFRHIRRIFYGRKFLV
ncbi:MAG: hypothetical protein IJA24_05090 [Alistipes sp.]|nr:hypothetical protein [Alistipes sp.]